MTSYKQDKDFQAIIQEMIPSDALSSAIDYISHNLDPEDVFDEKTLSVWAENNGYIKE